MNGKSILILAGLLAVAAIAGAAGYIVTSGNRRVEAQAKAQAQRSAAAKAQAETVRAEEEAKTQAAVAKTAEEKRQQAEVVAANERLAAERAAAEAKAAEEKAKAAAAESSAAAEKAKEAAAVRDAEKARAETARLEKEKAEALAKAEAAKAEAAANALAKEKAAGERVIAEAKALELRQIDFATMAQQLAELKQELDEREAALRPEKTITDLVWLPDEETEVTADGKVKPKKKEPYLAEKDRSLPPETRALAKTARLVAQDEKERADITRAKVVKDLESLYVAAIRADSPVDAEYYRQVILSLYPDWKYAGEATDEKAKKEGK